MARKKWTPQTEVTDSLLKFREKRKWQLTYRRYVLEGAKSESYAKYFGLDIQTLRHWFEIQFTGELSWENFGKAWQFDHVIPTNYFDFTDENDLMLCWSFINMRVGEADAGDPKGNSVDILAARPYFQYLYNRTGFSLCERMLAKIERIEQFHTPAHAAIENFIIQHKPMLENIIQFNQDEFNSLNQGSSVEDILLEREIFKKFG